MYAPTSFDKPESPLFLRRDDSSFCTISFICDKTSLMVPHKSSSLSDSSKTSSTHFPWWLCDNWSTSSTESNKSTRPLKLWHIDTCEDEDVACDDFSLSNRPSEFTMRGWDADGKLVERTWYVIFVSWIEVVIFLFSRRKSITKQWMYNSKVLKVLLVGVGTKLFYTTIYRAKMAKEKTNFILHLLVVIASCWCSYCSSLVSSLSETKRTSLLQYQF